MGIFTRKAADAAETPAEDPDLAALPEPARPMAKQALGRLQAEKDPAKIREQLDQMRGQASQVPPQMKPLFDFLLKKAEERLTELAKEGKK